jgi:hypothetical protein
MGAFGYRLDGFRRNRFQMQPFVGDDMDGFLADRAAPSGIPSYIGIKDSRTSKIFPKRIGAE